MPRAPHLFGVLAALSILCPAVCAEVEVTIIPDAWPSRPRVVGYEYNQKNHHDAPDFIKRRQQHGPSLVPAAAASGNYRLVGVRIENTGDEPVELELTSGQIRARKPIPITVPAHDWAAHYFGIKKPADLRFAVQLTPRKDTAIEKHAVLPEDGHAFRRFEDAWVIARELDHEDAKRRKLATRPVHVTVHDDLGLPVPGARLLFLAEEGLMVAEGKTGADGSYDGRVSPGAHHVYAFAEVPDRTDHDAQTGIDELPRLLVLEGTLAASGRELALRSERRVTVKVTGTDREPMVPSRIWITPDSLLGAYRYASIAGAIGSSARLDSQRANPGGRFLLLSTPTLTLDIALTAEPTDTQLILARARLAASTEPPMNESLDVRFDPVLGGTFVIDPTLAFGPGESAELELVAAEGARETLVIRTRSRREILVPAGLYRVALRYQVADGPSCRFIPTSRRIEPGQTIDLTPKAPFTTTLYWKRKAGKLQFWLAVTEAGGMVLRSNPTGEGQLTGMFEGKKVLDQSLGSLRWELGRGLGKIDLEKIDLVAEIPFGRETIRSQPKVEALSSFYAEGASSKAPGCLAVNANALLPAVKESTDSCKEHLGIGVGGIHMEFDIFMPPGVGGTGGGGRITLEVPALFPMAIPSDPLPGAFRHELGHNLGFGHDPYMLLADHGIDEGRFGLFGYRMLHSRDFQRTIAYLAADRHDDGQGWSPGPGVYAALRMLYGEGVHKKMLVQRRASEQTLALHGLSSIERIAILYSLVTQENVAWVFRAHGWPVFDERVALGLHAVNIRKKHPRQLNYGRLEGRAISSWWVYGPAAASSGYDIDWGEEEEDSAEEEAGERLAWRFVEWPSAFIRLDEDRPPAYQMQRYVLFRRVVATKTAEVRLVCAGDVQMEVSLNGTPLGYLDASPQYNQPVHDEYMINQKRAFTVLLYKGENTIQVAANQPPGSTGFTLEFMTAKGRALKLKTAPEGPSGENAESTRVERRNPVSNPSFEIGGRWPTGWIDGPSEPLDAIRAYVAPGAPGLGERCLAIALMGSVRGGVIQRIAVEPYKRYKLTAYIKTEGFAGETFVSFFTNEMHEQLGKTPPVRRPDSDWKRYQAKWFSGTSRATYLALYVKGTAGRVYFDGVTLEEIR